MTSCFKLPLRIVYDQNISPHLIWKVDFSLQRLKIIFRKSVNWKSNFVLCRMLCHLFKYKYVVIYLYFFKLDVVFVDSQEHILVVCWREMLLNADIYLPVASSWFLYSNNHFIFHRSG